MGVDAICMIETSGKVTWSLRASVTKGTSEAQKLTQAEVVNRSNTRRVRLRKDLKDPPAPQSHPFLKHQVMYDMETALGSLLME